MGYAARNNPTSVKAKNGELPPKQKKKMSKRESDAFFRKAIQDKTGLPALVKAMGGEYFYT